ncbi:hypothetical protein BX616_003006, partial [Lobosporangium transversale]
FLVNPKVKSLAPHLLEEINSQGAESLTTNQQDHTSHTKENKLPLLNGIIEAVSRNIFYGADADWSRLEEAKLKVIQEHGPEALKAAANLTEIDAQCASLIVSSIYDTVINLPPPSKRTRDEGAEKDEGQNTQQKGQENEKSQNEESTKDKDDFRENENSNVGPNSSPLWDVLGFGLIKSSNAVRMAKSIISPSRVCETTNTAYLKGVDDIVYYSSLTHGLAASALASAPSDSAIKSLDTQTIVNAVGKLAIEIQMAQSVARLVKLNPADPQVRTIIYLALTAENSGSPSAQNARDINNLVYNGLGNDIPEEILYSLNGRAALSLIANGTGRSGYGSTSLSSIPVVRSFFTFSSEVLTANGVGDILKYVFCPETIREAGRTKVEVVDDIKEGAEEAAKKGSKAAQKAFNIPEGAAKNVAEDAKAKSQETKENINKAAKNVAQEAKYSGENIKNKIEYAAENIRAKVVSSTEKVNAAGEQFAESVHDTAHDAKKNVKGAVGDIKGKAVEEEEAAKKLASEAAKKVADQVEKKAQRVADKADEVKQEL